MMRIRCADGAVKDHRRIRRMVYRLLPIIRAKGYGRPETGGVDGNVRRHRNVAIYDLKSKLRRHQRRLDNMRGG